jgi:hypothetical protein
METLIMLLIQVIVKIIEYWIARGRASVQTRDALCRFIDEFSMGTEFHNLAPAYKNHLAMVKQRLSKLEPK